MFVLLMLLFVVIMITFGRPQSEIKTVIMEYENTPLQNDSGIPEYSFSYATSDGIRQQEFGSIDSENGLYVQGSFSYTGTTGEKYTVHYIANKNGFQPFGKHLPNYKKPKGKALTRISSAAIASLVGR